MSAATLDEVARYELLLSYKFYCDVSNCDGLPHRLMPHNHARAAQHPPAGEWDVWAFIAGRGSGKTRSGVEWVKNRILNWTGEPNANRVIIVAPTLAVGRDVIVNGESGLIAVTPPDRIKGKFNNFTSELRWVNGGICKVFGADDLTDADRIRGYQAHSGYFDEIGTQRYASVAWDNTQFALRLGSDPKTCVTATPRPTPVIKRLLRPDPMTALTRGSLFDNAANLPESFIRRIREKYEGSRLEAQEIAGELVEDVSGALWRREDITVVDRVERESLIRVVVSIDPAGGHKTTGSKTGIVVIGMNSDDRCFVLEDLTDWMEPEVWAKVAVEAFYRWQADAVICEVNYGGDLVVSNLRTIDRSVNVRPIRASKGKSIRAEPVVNLYRQRQVVHVGVMADLEQELCGWIPPGQFEVDTDGIPIPIKGSDYSPDHLDAMVHGISELRLQPSAGRAVATFHRSGGNPYRPR